VLQAGSFERSPRQMAGFDPAVVTPHGGPSSPTRVRRSRLPANRTLLPGFGIQSHPRRQPMNTSLSGRIRTSASDLRRVVSRSAGRIHGPSDWNRTSDNVVVGHVLCS